MGFVGRRAELSEVERLLDRAAGGSGGVLVVTGPPGAGKTALLDAGAELAAHRRFQVLRASPSAGQPGRLVWAQLLGDVGADASLAAALLADPGPFELDSAARALALPRPRAVIVDDLDRGGPQCIEFLAVLATRAATAPVVVLAAAPAPLGVGIELRLKGLGEEELGELVGKRDPETRRAVYMASRGLPGVALSLAGDLRSLPIGEDPVVHLALHAASGAAFLEVDVTLVRLLETAIGRARDSWTRARLLARLSAALLGDASAAARRRSLADDALELARRTGDPQTLAEVLDARLQALWDPSGAEDRLAAGSEIVDLARAAGEDARERHGLFWRFVALMELGRVAEAESALAAFEREVALAGDAEAAVMVTARHAMLAILRGRFDEASRLAEETADRGRRVRLADADSVGATLRAAIAVERDPAVLADTKDLVLEIARTLPGHFYEATAARLLATLGLHTEAGVELERVLPRVLAGSGPRWLGAIADLAFVATATGDTAAAPAIYEALAPYRGRLVVFAGATTVWGPVSHYLGILATLLRRPAEAVAHLEEAVSLEEQIGALPYLAHSLDGLASALEARGGAGDARAAAESRRRATSIAERLGMTVLLERVATPAGEWTLQRDGDDWLLDAGGERSRLRDGRGLHYLRMLVTAPARDISALDLVAGGAGLMAPSADAVVDDAALRAFRRRLAELDAALDAADAAGDATRARRVEEERQALIGELRGATGLGGRPRKASPEAERARVNVTRTLRATIDRIEAAAPRTAAHLRASLRTGLACRYDPAPGGPARWRV